MGASADDFQNDRAIFLHYGAESELWKKSTRQNLYKATKLIYVIKGVNLEKHLERPCIVSSITSEHQTIQP